MPHSRWKTGRDQGLTEPEAVSEVRHKIRLAMELAAAYTTVARSSASPKPNSPTGRD